MLDDQASQLLGMTDVVAERVRKLGGQTLKSIGHIAKLQRVLNNDADYVEPSDMLAELCSDNLMLLSAMRELHGMTDEYRDVATSSLLDVWVDETEGRAWFLFESSRRPDSSGH